VEADPDLAAYAVVAHGLLTSASVIVGLAESLESQWASLDDERRRELVTSMGDQARTIHGVLQALVTAAPPEVFQPLRDAMAGQIHPVEAATEDRSAAATEGSPKTSID